MLTTLHTHTVQAADRLRVEIRRCKYSLNFSLANIVPLVPPDLGIYPIAKNAFEG